MENEKANVLDSPKMLEYKAMETRLYGELVKSCRRYHKQLSIISIVGILDLVKQEMKDLNKTDFQVHEEDALRDRESLGRLI